MRYRVRITYGLPSILTEAFSRVSSFFEAHFRLVPRNSVPPSHGILTSRYIFTYIFLRLLESNVSESDSSSIFTESAEPDPLDEADLSPQQLYSMSQHFGSTEVIDAAFETSCFNEQTKENVQAYASVS